MVLSVTHTLDLVCKLLIKFLFNNIIYIDGFICIGYSGCIIILNHFFNRSVVFFILINILLNNYIWIFNLTHAHIRFFTFTCAYCKKYHNYYQHYNNDSPCYIIFHLQSSDYCIVHLNRQKIKSYLGRILEYRTTYYNHSQNNAHDDQYHSESHKSNINVILWRRQFFCFQSDTFYNIHFSERKKKSLNIIYLFYIEVHRRNSMIFVHIFTYISFWLL